VGLQDDCKVRKNRQGRQERQENSCFRRFLLFFLGDLGALGGSKIDFAILLGGVILPSTGTAGLYCPALWVGVPEHTTVICSKAVAGS